MNNSKEINVNNNVEEQKVITSSEESNVSNSETKEDVTNNSKEEESEKKTTDDSNNENSNDKKDENTEAELKLTHLDKDFVYEVMSIPTNSNAEYRLVTFIILWARRNNIKYEFDDYGNIYLTKGELNEGEFYPCVTSHLDTVQTKQKVYAEVGLNLKLKTEITTSKKHKLYVDGMGIGADDKSGVLISLSMFNHVDKLKAAFFLQEEIGCKGSEHMNVDWFKNVGYVIGYDSPDLNRAAYSCSGVKLFSKDFFKNYIEEVCKEHGVTDFRSEPFTDVKIIREKTDIICMNFGNGGYLAHSSTEYCVIEDMDSACRMGKALIDKIGNTQHKLKHTSTYIKTTTGAYAKVVDEDEEFFRSLNKSAYGYGTYYGGTYTRGSYNDDDDYDYGYGGNYSGYYGGTNNSTSVKTTTSSTTSSSNSKENNEDDINIETLHYISDKYEEYVEDIKVKVKNKCAELNIDFNKEFEEIFSKEIKF